MKKSTLVLTALAMVTASFLTSCDTPAQKVENAQTNVKDANKALDKANEDYLAEIQSYRKEEADKIAANDQSIAEFKTRIAGDKKEAKAEYTKKIAELEQKNSDMKKKLDEYKADGKDKWEKFKTEFNHDMDEMGKAFKDLTVKNVK